MFWSYRIQQRLKERKEQKLAEEKKVDVMLKGLKKDMLYVVTLYMYMTVFVIF